MAVALLVVVVRQAVAVVRQVVEVRLRNLKVIGMLIIIVTNLIMEILLNLLVQVQCLDSMEQVLSLIRLAVALA